AVDPDETARGPVGHAGRGGTRAERDRAIEGARVSSEAVTDVEVTYGGWGGVATDPDRSRKDRASSLQQRELLARQADNEAGGDEGISEQSGSRQPSCRSLTDSREANPHPFRSILCDPRPE